MITKFGKICRNLRIDNGELLKNMAERLNVSSAFLSKVENGKAKPPVKWKEIIVNEYRLDKKQKEELTKSIYEAREDVIRINTFSQNDRDMLFAFIKQLKNMDKKEKDKWKRMLNL